ncbi:MAG: hypothetical protein IJ088_15780 [Clostridia bacterium]|nr:hypothetical protein [Clostridia bacterium]
MDTALTSFLLLRHVLIFIKPTPDEALGRLLPVSYDLLQRKEKALMHCRKLAVCLLALFFVFSALSAALAAGTPAERIQAFVNKYKDDYAAFDWTASIGELEPLEDMDWEGLVHSLGYKILLSFLSVGRIRSLPWLILKLQTVLIQLSMIHAMSIGKKRGIQRPSFVIVRIPSLKNIQLTLLPKILI